MRIAGRDRSKVDSLARKMDVESQVATLEDAASLRSLAASATVVLNAAGPFVNTSDPLLDACIAAGTHYLDITGEVPAIEAAASRHDAAVRSGVMLMPGVGFDVVPSDCLAAHVARRLPDAKTLRLGFHGCQSLSRGSVRTAIGQMGEGVWVRRGGTIASVGPGGRIHYFDYGAGPQLSVATSWGDVSAAFFSTGIPNIEVYFSATLPVLAWRAAERYWGGQMKAPAWRSWLTHQTRWMREGPSEHERRAARTTIVAEATDARGRCVRSRLHGPEAYSLTAAAAVAIAERCLAGEWIPGFQTPSKVFGADFALSFHGISRTDL